VGPLFTRDDAWAGGSYDLAIKLGARDDARANRALEALWSAADLDGCYEYRELEPEQQPRIRVGALPLEAPLHGIARIGARQPLPCRTVAIQFDDGEDWIYVCLPMGSLGRIFDVGAFPFSDGATLSWRPVLDEWLCTLARRVFDAVPFQLALFGWDGDDFSGGDRVATPTDVPDERWVGFLVPDAGALRWFAANRGAPFTIERT
jgi:hypothetical protein